MAKLPYIEFADGFRIPILHEDRNVIAIDKPQGWMLAPVSWQSTSRNLFAALSSSVNAGDFWAKSRSLKFIRFVHRLDADTSGVLLLVKAPGAMPAFTELFEDRKVEKVYLAVVRGVPEIIEWKCRLRLAPMQDRPGRMEVNNALGKDSETLFRVIDKLGDRALVMCWPLTGRTHQIRLHLAAVGHPVWADELYGHVPTKESEKTELKLGLRAIRISYKDPFMAEQVNIAADAEAFVKMHGFDSTNVALRNFKAPEKVLEHPKARFEEKRAEERAEREKERSSRREERAFGDDREGTRGDWQQDEDSGGFASAENNERGAAPFRERPPRQFGRGPRGDARSGDRPPPRPGYGRSFDGPRKFEPRAGGFGRKPAGGGYAGGGGGRDFENRPPRRPSFGKPFGGPREFPDGAGGGASERPRSFSRDDRAGGGERTGGFRGPPRDKPAFGRPNADRGPRDDRGGGGGFRRPAGGKPGYGRPSGDGGGSNRDRDDNWGNREGANERRAGVFQSSAKSGLQAGFKKFGASGSQRPPFRSGGGSRPFSSGGESRPYRPGGEGRPYRPAGEGRPFRSGGESRPFRGGGEGRPTGGRPPGKFSGSKPAWGKKPAGRPFKKF